ncbi:hypothetical protein TIFTF001_042108 [Ficus carica]|uniref:CCHC-type domain-containing protein n=1 Tax=Ficus carica TaxID=3494 RepID=A0AA88CXU8_FICCA|nr:hypothetical protein TIFTF001_042108 [Ficus carica]
MGSNACYLCGKEGHYARSCPLNNQAQNPPHPSRNDNSQLHAAQVRLEGPSIAQGRLEAPEPQARIYVLEKSDRVPLFLDSGITRAFDQRVFSIILEFHVSECVWAHVLWIQATGNAFRSLDPSFSIPMYLVENMINLLPSKLQNKNQLTS